ncbi:hypothetical protein CSUI_002016, partial [Cystoisospora suis]
MKEHHRLRLLLLGLLLVSVWKNLGAGATPAESAKPTQVEGRFAEDGPSTRSHAELAQASPASTRQRFLRAFKRPRVSAMKRSIKGSVALLLFLAVSVWLSKCHLIPKTRNWALRAPGAHPTSRRLSDSGSPREGGEGEGSDRCQLRSPTPEQPSDQPGSPAPEQPPDQQPNPEQPSAEVRVFHDFCLSLVPGLPSPARGLTCPGLAAVVCSTRIVFCLDGMWPESVWAVFFSSQ